MMVTFKTRGAVLGEVLVTIGVEDSPVWILESHLLASRLTVSIVVGAAVVNESEKTHGQASRPWNWYLSRGLSRSHCRGKSFQGRWNLIKTSISDRTAVAQLKDIHTDVGVGSTSAVATPPETERR